MAKRNCKICGKEYKVCPTCATVRTFTPWRMVTCSQTEFLVYELLSKYDLDKDIEAAGAALEKLGIDDKVADTYLPSVSTVIHSILEATAAPKKNTKRRSKKVTDGDSADNDENL